MIVLALALQLATTPPSVADKAAPAARLVKTEDPDKLICRSEAATGRRISAQVCHTRGEWTQLQDASNRLMDHNYHTYGQGNTCPPGQAC